MGSNPGISREQPNFHGQGAELFTDAYQRRGTVSYAYDMVELAVRSSDPTVYRESLQLAPQPAVETAPEVQTASVLGSAAIDTAAPSNDNWEENWNLQSDDSATVNQGLLESLENDLGVNDLGVQGDYDRAA